MNKSTPHYLKRIIVPALMLLALPIAAAMVNYAPDALASPATDEACKAIGGCDDGGSDIDRVITIAVNTFTVIVGIVAVIMIIISGFKYITAGGDSGKVSSAKSTLIYAIVGLAIVALAQFIVQFILARVD